jgi:RHS repeat-associated protein
VLGCDGSGVPTASQFTGQDHDWESNLEHFWFRQYSSTQGRWMTPDPAGLGAVDPSNPQSWNQYSYVADNPVNFVDSLGMLMAEVQFPCGFTEENLCLDMGDFGGGFFFSLDLGGAGPRSPRRVPWTRVLPGEKLGVPDWMNMKPLSVWQLLGLVPIENWCDYGPCVFNMTGVEDYNGSNLTLANVWDCAKQWYIGVPAVAGAGGLAATYPILTSRGKMAGAIEGTSVFSKYLGKRLGRFDKAKWAPTAKNLASRTAEKGRYYGRWTGWVSAGVLAADAVGILMCVGNK